MRRWTLPKLDLQECKFGREPTNWQLPEMKQFTDELNACKSRMDAPYKENARRFDEYTIQMEISLAIRDEFVRRFNGQHVTNAWLKLIEIVAEFDIVNGQTPIRMFDNASAPGAFILAMNYWTKNVKPIPFEWKASTWIEDPYVALGDTYGLARTYPQNFTTTGTERFTRSGIPFNGDTMDVRYLRYMQNKYSGAFNLYTSDLGMRVPEGMYNYQEAVNARGNLGQILMGLITLERAGTLITKQFSHMTAFTISLMAILSSVFEYTYIVKPITSKTDNSEEYMVCIGYNVAPAHLIDMMFDALEMSESVEIDITRADFFPALIPRECISEAFIRAILGATRDLVSSQCAKIDSNLAEYVRMVNTRCPSPSVKFVKENMSSAMINKWFTIAPFTRADSSRDWIQVAPGVPDRRRQKDTRARNRQYASNTGKSH